MRVLVVGGGAAGMTCASLLKRRREDADVTVLERGSYVSFSACGMPYWLEGTIEGPPQRLVVLDAETARRERGIDVRTGTEVIAVDARAGRATVEGPTGEEEHGFDRLVLATGAEAVDPFTDGQARNVLTFRHLDDGVRAGQLLAEHSPDTACVVGGGFVGIEMADALAERGVQTTLVQDEEHLMGGRLAPRLGEHLDDRLEEAGVTVLAGTMAEEVLVEQDLARAVSLEDGVVEADVVVVAVGTRPRTQLAEAAGCSIADAGGIGVDEGMRTDVDDVYACGDCVAYPHRLTGGKVLQPLALHANRSGRIAGQTILGEQASFPGVLGTAITRFRSTEVALTGLTEPEARQVGFEAVGATIEASTRAGYFPGSGEALVHLVAEEGTGRLLGGQIVGGPGAGKRIDTLASALWMEASCRQLEGMDLAYSPPVSPTWDPVAIAARMAAREAGQPPV